MANNKTYFVHVLVAMSFIGAKPSDEHTVDHIDQNKGNNKLENLRWATREEQADNSVSKAVNVYKDGKFIKLYTSRTSAAKDLGFSRYVIYKYLKKDKSYDGYTFKPVA